MPIQHFKPYDFVDFVDTIFHNGSVKFIYRHYLRFFYLPHNNDAIASATNVRERDFDSKRPKNGTTENTHYFVSKNQKKKYNTICVI